MLTDYNAKYICGSDNVEKVTAMLFDSKMDLHLPENLGLLDEIGQWLEQKAARSELFTVHWRVT